MYWGISYNTECLLSRCAARPQAINPDNEPSGDAVLVVFWVSFAAQRKKGFYTVYLKHLIVAHPRRKNL